MRSSSTMASLLSGWHHYAVVYDAQELSVKVYVDRQCVVSQTLSYPLRTNEGEGYYFGCMGNNNFFAGNIDEIRVTKAALPPDRFLFANRRFKRDGSLRHALDVNDSPRLHSEPFGKLFRGRLAAELLEHLS